MLTKQKNILILIGILLLGTILRFYHNTDISLWHDEAFSALLIKYSWSEMMYRIGLDVHPPLYYIALRLWSYVFGTSLLALRGMSIFFGLGTILVGWAFVKAFFKNEKAALFTALLLAVNPFQLQYVSEARMYTMGAFLAIFAVYSLSYALGLQKQFFEGQHKLKTKALVWYTAFVMATAAMIYTHYYLLFTAATLCLYALLWHTYHYRLALKKYFWLLGSYLLIAISFLPWLKIFLFQYKQVSADYWIPKMDKWSIPLTIWKMAVGMGVDINKTTVQYLVVISTLVVGCILIYTLFKLKYTEKWLPLFAFLAPFGGSILFYLLSYLKCLNATTECKVNSVFLDRYFLYAATFLTIFIALWLVSLKKKWLGITLFAVYSLSGILIFSTYWNDIKIEEKGGMNDAAKLLHANVGPADKVYVASSFEFFNLKYYRSQPNTTFPIRPKLFSGGNKTVKSMPHYAGTAILTDADLLPNFNDEVAVGDTVWLLWTTAFGGSKPTVPANWVQVGEAGFADVRPYVGTWIVITTYEVRSPSTLHLADNKNLTRSDRSLLYSMLRWSPECEQDFQDTYPTNSSGLESYQLEEGVVLLRVGCVQGAYQGSYEFFSYNGETGSYTPHIFPQFDSTQVSLVPRHNVTITGETFFNDETATLSILEKFRGLGDCGIRYTYRMSEFDAQILNAHGNLTCNATASKGPDSWPSISIANLK